MGAYFFRNKIETYLSRYFDSETQRSVTSIKAKAPLGLLALVSVQCTVASANTLASVGPVAILSVTPRPI